MLGFRSRRGSTASEDGNERARGWQAQLNLCVMCAHGLWFRAVATAGITTSFFKL